MSRDLFIHPRNEVRDKESWWRWWGVEGQGIYKGWGLGIKPYGRSSVRIRVKSQTSVGPGRNDKLTI